MKLLNTTDTLRVSGGSCNWWFDSPAPEEPAIDPPLIIVCPGPPSTELGP